MGDYKKIFLSTSNDVDYIHINIAGTENKFKCFKFSDRIFPRSPGIYGVICLENNKFIVGLTKGQKGFHGRWISYKSFLRNNRQNNRYMQNSFNAYKEDSFLFFIIEESNENLSDLEIKWIKKLKSKIEYGGWNITEGGESPKMSEETKRRISVTNEGRTFSKNRNLKVCLSKIGICKDRSQNYIPQKRIKCRVYRHFISDGSADGGGSVAATLIDFNQRVVDIYDVKKFSEINGLPSKKSINRVIRADRFSCYGWTLLTKEISNLSYEDFSKKWDQNFCHLKTSIKNYQVLSTIGEIVNIENLKEFCNKNNLNYQLMHRIVHNKLSCLTHHGYKNVDFDKILDQRVNSYE